MTKVMSSKGTIVDFDLLAMQSQINEQKTISVKANTNVIPNLTRRSKKLDDVASKQKQLAAMQSLQSIVTVSEEEEQQ